MGQYRIIIDGTGAHHNGKDYDADAVTKETVAKLEASGHKIRRASFNLGYENPSKPGEWVSGTEEVYRDEVRTEEN